MALSVERKNEIKKDLEETGGATRLFSQRIIPEDYESYQTKVERKEIELPVPKVGVPVKCYIAIAKDKAKVCPVHINVHGGGFIFGHEMEDDLYSAYVAANIHGMVIDIDYATSWDHPFPVAFEQCYAVAQWVFTKCEEWGADPSKISMGGHSAGGCLTAAVALKAAETKDFNLCLQVLDYAAIDNYSVTLSENRKRETAFSMLYADGDIETLQTPYCSPAFATDEMISSQPKALIITAGQCPFKEVNEKYGKRLASKGTEVIMKSFVNSKHGFTVHMTGAWRQALELIVKTILDSSLNTGLEE